MNPLVMKLRARLRETSPLQAIDFIRSFNLPADEETCLIECDIHKLTYMQLWDKTGLSAKTINRRRRQAYIKILDELNHGEGWENQYPTILSSISQDQIMTKT